MKYLYSLIGIVIVVAIIFLIAKPGAPKEQAIEIAATPTTSVTILVNEAGFTPEEVTMKVGETVTFKNTGAKNHWPASDPHPAHTTYSAFDPRKGLVPGETWSFTFDKPGTWRLHDHLSALNRGVVNVLAEGATVVAPQPVSQTAGDCPDSSADFNCFEKHYQKIVREGGVPAAFADLRKKYESSSYVRSQCHPLTHVIGRSATLLYPKVSDAYTHGDAFCWSGYYHGVMEGIAGKIGIEKIASEMNNICTDIPGRANYSFDYYNCVHGLGHGVMALTYNELFDSLRYCDNLAGGWERTSCYGGVFMENVIVDNKNHFTKYLKPAEPLYPCTAVEGKYKGACYLMQTSYAMKVTGNNFAKVFEICRTADLEYRSTCFQSLGRDASGQSISAVGPTKTACDLGANYEEKSNCIIGAVKDFISYHHSDVQAKQLCAAISSDLFQICTDTATAYYKSL